MEPSERKLDSWGECHPMGYWNSHILPLSLCFLIAMSWASSSTYSYHGVLTPHRPHAIGKTNCGPKSLKLWAKINFSSSQVVYLRYFCQCWKVDWKSWQTIWPQGICLCYSVFKIQNFLKDFSKILFEIMFDSMYSLAL
jgi:hypothetical protein